MLLLVLIALSIFNPNVSYSMSHQKLNHVLSAKKKSFSHVTDFQPVQAKKKLLQTIDGIKAPDIYIDPSSMSPLTLESRYIGFAEKSYFKSAATGAKYEIKPNYYDFVIANEMYKPFWEKSVVELFTENFFQTHFISSIYERGYRQNFKNFGFPGIEKEYAEATELFATANASTILDISCGSGFMTRKFIESKR